MDPFTTVSFAVAVVQASAIAAKTCKNIYRLQTQLRNAPADIVRLTLDVELLNTLLLDLCDVTRELPNEGIPPNVISLWTRKEKLMHQDLEKIQKLTDRLTELLQSPTVSPLQLRARLRMACSESTVTEFLEVFSKHIEFIGVLHGLLNRSKLSSLDRLAQGHDRKLNHLTDQVSTLNASVRDGFDATQNFLDVEFPVAKLELSDLITSVTNDYRYRSQPSAMTELAEEHQATHSMDQQSIQMLESQSLEHTSRPPLRTELRAFKPIYWSWSAYNLPIGVLTIEKNHMEVKCSKSRTCPNRANSYTVKFRLAPLPWFMDRIIQASYSISISAGHLPSWQLTMSDDTSLIPTELEDTIQEGSLIDFLDYMEAMPYSSAHRLMCTKWNWSHSLCERTATKISNSPLLDFVICRTVFSASGYYSGRGIELRSKRMHINTDERSPRLRFWIPSIPLACLDPQCSNPESQQSSVCYQIIFNEAGIDDVILDHLYYPPPTICLPPSKMGVELFRQFVCPHLDPVHLTQMRDRDRWWLSALMYAEPGFEAALISQLKSFRSHPSLTYPQYRQRPSMKGFVYLENLQEIIDAPQLEREIFVSWVSLLGTGSMLQQLISAGLGLDQRLELVHSYLSTAAQVRNMDVFQVLLAAGARTIDSNDALAAFNCLPRSTDDCLLIDNLLKATPMERSRWPFRLPYLSSYWLHEKGAPPDPYVARRLIDYYHASQSHPPHKMEHYLGDEVIDAVDEDNHDFLKFLVENEAGLEKVNRRLIIAFLEAERPTVLEMAVVFGQVRNLELLLDAKHGYENRIQQLERALDASKMVLTFNHARTDYPSFKKYSWDHKSGWRDKSGRSHNSGISLETDIYMHNLIRKALREAGVHHEDSSDGADLEELERKYEERVQRARERRKRVSTTIWGPKPARLSHRRRESVKNGNNTTSARAHSQNKTWARFFKRVMANVHRKIAAASALELILVVIGTVLGLYGVAIYSVWELALWFISLPHPPKVALRTLLVILACLVGLKYLL